MVYKREVGEYTVMIRRERGRCSAILFQLGVCFGRILYRFDAGGVSAVRYCFLVVCGKSSTVLF